MSLILRQSLGKGYKEKQGKTKVRDKVVCVVNNAHAWEGDGGAVSCV
jgi:hypothetical protein